MITPVPSLPLIPGDRVSTLASGRFFSDNLTGFFFSRRWLLQRCLAGSTSGVTPFFPMCRPCILFRYVSVDTDLTSDDDFNGGILRWIALAYDVHTAKQPSPPTNCLTAHQKTPLVCLSTVDLSHMITPNVHYFFRYCTLNFRKILQ
ncbi:unnamed protein product [Brassica oleracea var. botrytis]|uniref:(rape) hypothetical protein n=1 Tax=Brassica napus TaxID=3708 RepID=A0A816HYK8_BRANA|nr:unnamed protein product [Brassica napus]